MKICAGIVLYNPDAGRLKKSIDAISPQVDQLVFIDNASDNIEKLQKEFDDDGFVWIKNEINKGIATALNQLAEFAKNNEYEWILTLDQDSICQESFVKKLIEAVPENENDAGGKKIAMAGPLIIDRGIADSDVRKDKPMPDSEEVKLCITSGCLTNVKAIQDIGGFNDWLFVYDVDREICIRLLRGGYRLIRVNTTSLCHEHGLKTVTKKVLWKNVVYRNYTPASVYYMTRNLVYMLRKYGKEYAPSPFLRWIRLYIAFGVKFICEPDRIQRLKAFSKGIKDGLAVNINEV